MRRLRLVAILLFTLLAGAAYAQTVLKAGLDVDAGTMDPRLAQDTSAAHMNELIFNGLVRISPELVAEPDLATSWSYNDPTTVTFKLRPNVKFQNGDPFTAQDVVYTYDTILNEDFGAPRRSLYTPIESVKAIDDLTVQFKLKEAYAPLLMYLNMGIVPHTYAESMGKDFSDNPIGTGPFELKSWDKGSKITLAANANYYKGKPKIDTIEISVIPDNNVRLIALESGDLDFITSPVPPQDLARIKGEKNLVVEQTTALGYTYLNLNLHDPILQDVRVRQALAYLTDTATISDAIFYGLDTPASSFLLPNTFYYTDNVTKYPYNLEKANQLLDEAGWKAGSNGIRQKDGMPLHFDLTTNVDPNRQQILEYLQTEWKKAGIDVSVRVYQWPSFIADVQAGKYQVACLGWLGLVDPDRASFLQFNTTGGNNWEGYSNPKVDQLLEQGRRETDPNKRKDIYTQVAQTVTQDLPYIYLVDQGYVVVHYQGLEGYQINPSGSWRSLDSATFTRQSN